MTKSKSKKFLCLSTALFFVICLNAQNRTVLSGRITDSSSNKAIDYATITLATAEGKVLNGTTSDSTGNFKISDIDAGIYNISFEFIGYKKKVLKNFHITKDVSLGTISLQKFETTLKDVIVTSQTKLIDNRIDKLVFNAENDVTSQGGVATDILKKIPQVSVDADGNVELAGSGGVRFLINGKPSSAFGSNVADVLQSIPASQIKSIEVITNPGARYDAQGLGGIINIILKQTKVNGINSNISLSAGTRIENGSFNITARHGNFGLNAFISGNRRLTAATPFTSDRISVDTIAKENVLLHQQSDTRSNRHGLESGIGFDWTIKKYNSLSGNINYNRFGSKNNGVINQEQKTTFPDSSVNDADVFSLNHLSNSFLFYSTDASISYKRTFKKEDQSLEINLNTSFGNNRRTANNYQNLLSQDSVFYGVSNNNFGKENEKELEINYTQPFTKNISFDAGADITFNDITSTSNVYALQPAAKIYLYDTSVSNYLTYHQKVYAAYAEISFPVGNLFDAKIGSRYERTEINSFYSDATQQIKNPGYNTLVPSVYFLRKLTEDQSLKLSYSKRIERPDYGDLNPFVNTADPKNITAGNPYLKPEIGNRIELSYNHDFGKSSSLTITAFYRANNHDIQPYTAYYPELIIGDSVYTNVSVSTRENIGLEKNAGISLFGNVQTTDKLTLRMNLFFFRRHIINGIDSGRNPTSFNYRINLNASYKFSNNFSAEFFGNFNSARNELQGKYPSFTTYTIAARKQFWNKKGSVALTATNLFDEYVNQPTIIYGTNFTTNSIRKIPFRSIGLNFTWKFGKLDFKKDKEDDNNLPVPPDN